MNPLRTLCYLCFGLLAALPLRAQGLAFCGTYMPYDTLLVDYGPPPPEGYELLALNHLGRHGSRYPVSAEGMDMLLSQLWEADRAANLTPEGKALQAQLQDMRDRCEGQWGQLSPLGSRQQQGIGRRMLTRLGAAPFDSLLMWLDPKERCLASGQAFLWGVLQARPQARKAQQVFLPPDNPLLNFFDTDSAYRAFKAQGPWKTVLRDYRRSLLADSPLPARYLRDASRLDPEARMDFCSALYASCAIGPNLPMPAEQLPVLPIAEMERLWKLENARQYLEKGPWPSDRSLQVLIARPLLRHFLLTTRHALQPGARPRAYLRFAHAETLIPFLSLLGIPQASQATADPAAIWAIWQDYRLSPMAANVVWVVYRHRQRPNDYLVKMLLNEQCVPFPLPTGQYPYYDLQQVLAYYEGALR